MTSQLRLSGLLRQVRKFSITAGITTGIITTLLGAGMSSAHADGNALNGQSLFHNGIGGGTPACATCHGSSPAQNVNGIQAANQSPEPAFLTNVFATLDPMKSIFGATITATQIADLAAYIANPNVVAAAGASLAPSSLTFSGTTVGQSSAPMSATLTNSGNSPLSISAVALGGANAADFAIGGSSCAAGATVAAGASCSVTATFTPGAAGSRSASVTISHNAAGGSSALALNGVGNAVPQATIAVSATSVNFGSVATGTQSPAQTVNVTNSGQAPLTLSAITLGGTNTSTFTVGGTCSTTTAVAAGASCTLTVQAAPATTGALAANIALASNASNGATAIGLSVTGAAPAPALSANPASVAFGTQTIATAATQNVTVSNTGNIPVTLGAIKVSGASSVVIGSGGTCGTTLAIAASCNVPLTFTPTAAGAATATLTVASNAPTLSVAVTGTGTAVVVAQPVLSDSKAIAFADTQIGMTAMHTTTLSNPSSAALKITSLSVTGTNAADFTLGGSCAVNASVSPAANCTIETSFKPSAAGSRVANLVLVTDSGAQLTLALSGNGLMVQAVVPVLNLTPQSFDFGAVTIGATAPTHSFTLSNGSTAALNVASLVFSGPFSAVSGSGNCAAAPFSLAAGASCTLVVQYLPTTAGTTPGSVVITGDAGGTIALSGEASVAVVTPPATTSAGSTNQGGGGCSAAKNGDDATLVMLVLMAIGVIVWRRRPAKRA
jgi:hypothetical protein